MIAYIIPAVMTISLLICAGVGFLIGYFKGAIKGAVDIGVTVFCAIISIPITKLTSMILTNEKMLGFVISKLLSILPEGVSSYVTGIQELLADEATQGPVREIIKLILSLPVVIVAPIAFVVIFIALSVVAHIIAFIVQMLVCPKTKNVGLRILGGGLTGSAGALIMIVLLIPVIGYANLTSNTIEHFQESTELTSTEIAEAENGEKPKSYDINEKINDVLDTVDTYIKPVKNTPVSKVVYFFGGKGIFNILTTTEVSRVDINLEKEIAGVIDIYDVAMTFVDNPPKEYGEEQTEAIDKLNEALEDSEFLPLLLSKTISFTANEFYQGHSILGIEKPDLGEEINPTLDRVLAVLKDTDSDAIREDLKTASNLADSVVDSGLVDELTAEEKNIWRVFENELFVEELLQELYKNERTRNIVPYVTGALTNYVYDMYNDINGTDLKPREFDDSNYNEAQLKEEAKYIANAVREIHSFVDTTDTSSEADPQDVIINSDMGALGRGLENLREGMFTDRLFELLIHAILHSEGIGELGIIDEYIIEAASKPDADLEGMLVARQNILKLAIAIKEKQDKTDLMNVVIESLLDEDGEALAGFVNKDNLISIGMSEAEAESIESIVGSMIDGVNNCELSDEEKMEEIHKTEEIISAVGNTVLDKNAENMFATDSGDDSTTGMDADEFVSKITDSKLASSMIQSAVVDENGEVIDDPYKIQGQISESDMNQISQAINNSYSSESTTAQDKETLEALAGIFGVTIE